MTPAEIIAAFEAHEEALEAIDARAAALLSPAAVRNGIRRPLNSDFHYPDFDSSHTEIHGGIIELCDYDHGNVSIPLDLFFGPEDEYRAWIDAQYVEAEEQRRIFKEEGLRQAEEEERRHLAELLEKYGAPE